MTFSPMDAYRVLLFYAYAPILAPEKVCLAQRSLCEQLGLRGRILIAKEGINATLSGTISATSAYMAAYSKQPELGPPLQSSDFKQDTCTGHLFPRLQVRVRSEIVRADLLVSTRQQAPYLKPRQLRTVLQQCPPDWLLLDVRDDYEHRLGYFRGALRLPIRYFRQLKHIVPQLLAPFKDKHILTYCTGGIRCEKAAAFLLSQNFSKVYQLQGGIIAYAQQTDGAFFEGSCYVFDARLRRPVNQVQATVVGRCYRCNQPTERVTNCAYQRCHRHTLLCDACVQRHTDTCSTFCEAQLPLQTTKPPI